jgi:lipoyl(octanoyl) transferase
MRGFHYEDLGIIEYGEALRIQTEAFQNLIDAKIRKQKAESHLFFCEHLPVITLGKNGLESNLLVTGRTLEAQGISLYHTNRGGDITFHGPGQITGYPVFDLEYFRVGLRQYVETIEEIMIRFLTLYDIRGERLPGASGVWIDPATERARKICAIGIKSSRFVTMHGFAMNINTDLHYFSLINPCGFHDKGVTTLSNETGRPLDINVCKKQLVSLFAEMFHN